MIKEILKREIPEELKSLFSFDSTNTTEQIVVKFNLWARHFYPQYFKSKDADFHAEINLTNVKLYSIHDELEQFINIAFRGAGKDVKTKLLIAFATLNDIEHTRRFYKVLSNDIDNAVQTVTDIYNMFVNPRLNKVYPEVFEKTVFKRAERQDVFTTATGIKIIADTVGVEQRGDNQEEARPDFIWYNDFETRKTLRSFVVTKAIWDNMEEARTGLEKGGVCLYTCNYISELGNVHKLVEKGDSSRRKILIIPIEDKEGNPTWARYTKEDIQHMRETDEDFDGERMCKPSASKDVMFDREKLDKMSVLSPIKVSAEFQIFRKFDPSHRYGSGHDVAGGVNLDSSASTFIDFSTVPAQVVGTFASNTISPESFGDEVYRESEMFGGNLVAIENNKFDQAILKAKQLGCNLYRRTTSKDTKINPSDAKELGWNTNSLTKPTMVFDLVKAVNDGLLELNDVRLIAEAKTYSRNDLIDKETDPRNTTRHFDLLTSCAIAWQMRNHATVVTKQEQSLDEYIDDSIRFEEIGI